MLACSLKDMYHISPGSPCVIDAHSLSDLSCFILKGVEFVYMWTDAGYSERILLIVFELASSDMLGLATV